MDAAGRRAQCVNNLKQIGLALNSYVATHQFYPGVITPTGYVAGHPGPFSAHEYSPLARMLGELDQIPLYNASNLASATVLSRAENQTVMTVSITFFLCPSDTQPPVAGYGRVNYRFNIGPTPWTSPGYGTPNAWSGPFTTHEFHSPADFADGLSNTIGVSERLQGGWVNGLFKPHGDYHLTNIGNGKVSDSADWALQQCAQIPTTSPADVQSGESWFVSGFHFTNYNHCQTPNGPVPDCAFEPFDDVNFKRIQEGVFTATSRHPGGVHTLFMDGSVHFVKNSVALAVWRALATRSGGEVVSAGAY
ncbi:MAG: DUF1559 domain-containing protein [Planctomycetota bacterium]|nr:DUF1559 domain-containing protein [Planctomycetota bacterium]